MIRFRALPFLLVLLAPALAFAQPEHLPESLRDSLEAFLVGMRADTIRKESAAPPSEYVLVWTDHCDGGPSWITRGNGTVTLATFNYDGRQEDAITFFHGGVPSDAIFFGDRYALIDVELPTGLIRYTRWYFERRGR